jgi:hypothetical protein
MVDGAGAGVNGEWERTWTDTDTHGLTQTYIRFGVQPSGSIPEKTTRTPN